MAKSSSARVGKKPGKSGQSAPAARDRAALRGTSASRDDSTSTDSTGSRGSGTNRRDTGGREAGPGRAGPGGTNQAGRYTNDYDGRLARPDDDAGLRGR